MNVNDSGVFKVNKDMILPAKVLKVNADKTGDIMVFVHPDAFPEFSRVECSTGSAIRRNVEEGLENNEFEPQR